MRRTDCGSTSERTRPLSAVMRRERSVERSTGSIAPGAFDRRAIPPLASLDSSARPVARRYDACDAIDGTMRRLIDSVTAFSVLLGSLPLSAPLVAQTDSTLLIREDRDR